MKRNAISDVEANEYLLAGSTFRASYQLQKSNGNPIRRVIVSGFNWLQATAALYNNKFLIFSVALRSFHGRSQGEFLSEVSKSLEDFHRKCNDSGRIRESCCYWATVESDDDYVLTGKRHVHVLFALPMSDHRNGHEFYEEKFLPHFGRSFHVPDHVWSCNPRCYDWNLRELEFDPKDESWKKRGKFFSPLSREQAVFRMSYYASSDNRLNFPSGRFVKVCSFRKFRKRLEEKGFYFNSGNADPEAREPFNKPELPSAEIMELAFEGKEKASPCAESSNGVSVRRKASCTRKAVSEYLPLPSLSKFSLRQEDVDYRKAFPKVDSEFVPLPEPVSADVVGERTSAGEVDSLELVSDFTERDFSQSQCHVFDPDFSKLLVVGSEALAMTDDPARSLADFARVGIENELSSADVVAGLVVAAEHPLGQVEVAHCKFIVEPAGASGPPQEREANRAVGDEVVHVVVDLASADRVGADQVGVNMIHADDFSGHFKPVVAVEREVEGIIAPNLESVLGKFDDGVVNGVVKLFASKLDGNERVAKLAVNPVAELVARPDVALVRHESFEVGVIRNDFFGLRIFNGNDPPLTVFGVINELSRGVFGDQQRVEPGDMRSVVSKNDNSSKLLSRDFDHRFVIRIGRQSNVKARAPTDHEVIGGSLVVGVHFNRIVALAAFNFRAEEAWNVRSDDLPSLFSSAVAQLHRSEFILNVELPIGAVDEVVARSVDLNGAGDTLHRDFDERAGGRSFRKRDFDSPDVADDQVVRRSYEIRGNFNRNVAAFDDLLRLRRGDEPPDVVLCVEDEFSRAIAFTELEDRVVADRRAGGRNDRNRGLDELGCDFDGSEVLWSFRQRNHQSASEADDQIGRLGLKRFRSFYRNVAAPLLAFSGNIEFDAPDSFNRVEDRQIDDEIFLFPADGQLLRRVVSPVGSIEHEPILIVVELDDRFSLNGQLRLGEDELSSRIQIGVAEGEFVSTEDDAA